MMRKLLMFVALSLICSSCVSNKVYNASRAEVMRLESELSALRARHSALEQLNNELNGEKLGLQDNLSTLTAEHDALRKQYASLDADRAKLARDLDQLRDMLDKGNAEASRMLQELQRNQADLEERSQRVEELESLLKAREEAIAAIRRQVSDALLGFEGKGLTISTRDGKVYVSMEDKLLFRSGSYEIGRDGEKAVRDLAKVLAANPDINVMVEGHTDDVRYTPNAYLKDNLDLSAKRATTVVRLLLENKEIAPERIVAAGRGESLPVAEGKTAEARAKNRRTEIILTPKYDELMKLMETTNNE
ncbi:MAG: OmpA family protein [Rikenellaceae bacterium]|nr:OmpA family protein [Rikenellaceae bacterium]MBP3682428.1 OmpA family protein [Rikenellaceae bacterium]MBQ3254477.1 OmpA family protein [Rikenellaceae bacterium]MBQ7790674.1 OmpA family protein [Rikenellaceae bacterium]MBR2049360.1 OmpA family protein [Rikenellaceae bacterium]